MAATPEQRAQAAVLVACSSKSRQEIAEAVGIGVATLYRWLREDGEFRGLVAGHRQIADEEIEDGLRGVGLDAVAALHSIINDGEQESNRRQAAKDVLAFVLGSKSKIEHSGAIGNDDAERLAAIEAELAALDNEPEEDTP